MTKIENKKPEEIAEELSQLVKVLRVEGRNDLLLRSISIPVLEELCLEAAKTRLSHLRITKDYRIFLVDYGYKEIDLNPVHKAVYLLFLNHPKGIEFKYLRDYRNELLGYYMITSRTTDKQTIIESVEKLIDPLNNSINEKCSRIKKVFLSLMDAYSASYYYISGHTQRHIEGSSRIWYERLKIITLPRDLVEWEK